MNKILEMEMVVPRTEAQDEYVDELERVGVSSSFTRSALLMPVPCSISREEVVGGAG